jgi:hypothetical protein
LDLRPEQLLDGLGCGQCGAIDAVENGIEGFERAWQAQVGQHLPEAITTGGRGALGSGETRHCIQQLAVRHSGEIIFDHTPR